MKKLLLFFVSLVSADTVVASVALRRLTGVLNLSASAQVARGQMRRFGLETPSRMHEVKSTLTENTKKLASDVEGMKELAREQEKIITNLSKDMRAAVDELGLVKEVCKTQNDLIASLHQQNSQIRWRDHIISVFIAVLVGDVFITEVRQYVSRDVIVRRQEEHQKLMAVLELVAKEVALFKKAQQDKETQVEEKNLNQELTHFAQLIADIKAGRK